MSLWTHIPNAFTTLAATGADAGVADIEMGRPLFLLIPALPALAALLCGLYWALGVKSKFPAWTTVAALAGSFAVTLVAYFEIAAPGLTHVVHGFRWINIAFGAAGGERMLFVADFSLYIDSLTVLWMLFVTGLATLIALYASEYMSADVGPGYCRFFFAFSLFVVAMACLVMGDNLLMLFLGWEGVGLCSYLLIGYFFKKPSAVNAAKKAFVMNRIGDLGLMVGIMLAFLHFGSLRYEEIFAQVAILQQDTGELAWTIKAIPFLLLVGAIGKSAQLPLFTWLPDAMEGPTPVSALIHAATMVTAGVYLVARTYPLFLLTPESLTLVAWIGGLTALVAATIGMAQYDIKRIMAYSTVSQLGFMFLGLGVLTSVGAAFHVFTHAFFKAALFLCCGAVMHGFAGQLDLRKLSGVQFMKGWGIVGVAMFVGCINLAGVPFTAGFFSKDMILAEAFTTPGFAALGVIALLTAGITAYYTFRVYFRVFLGPKYFEPGDELHGHDDHGHDEHGGAALRAADDGEDVHGDGHGSESRATGHGHDHDFHPHAPGWAINTVLVLLAVGSILAALAYVFPRETGGWVKGLVSTSTAAGAAYGDHHEASFFGLGDPHKVMYYVSGVIALIGIAIAWWLHLAGRTTAATSRADALKNSVGPVGRWAERKWYFDEIYDFLFRYPLLIFSHIFYLFDKLVIDGLVDLFGRAPRGVGAGVRPTQSGGLQNYAMGMAGGLAFIIVVAWLVVWRMSS